jgi:hypothetical protein
MLRTGYAVLIALTLPLQSCASQDRTASPTALPSDAVVVEFDRFETIGNALMGGPHEAVRSVVRDQEEWQAFWHSLTMALDPSPEPPTVDFMQDMVLVAGMGQRPTGGYLISVEGVYTSGGELYVDVLERSPGVGCLSTQAISTPVTAVRVSAYPGSVHFLTREESPPCT